MKKMLLSVTLLTILNSMHISAMEMGYKGKVEGTSDVSMQEKNPCLIKDPQLGWRKFAIKYEGNVEFKRKNDEASGTVSEPVCQEQDGKLNVWASIDSRVTEIQASIITYHLHRKEQSDLHMYAPYQIYFGTAKAGPSSSCGHPLQYATPGVIGCNLITKYSVILRAQSIIKLRGLEMPQ